MYVCVCVAKLSMSENNNNREFLRSREGDTAARTKSYKEVHTHTFRESIYRCHHTYIQSIYRTYIHT